MWLKTSLGAGIGAAVGGDLAGSCAGVVAQFGDGVEDLARQPPALTVVGRHGSDAHDDLVAVELLQRDVRRARVGTVTASTTRRSIATGSTPSGSRARMSTAAGSRSGRLDIVNAVLLGTITRSSPSVSVR